MTLRSLALAAAAALSLTAASPVRAMDMAAMQEHMMMISGLLFTELATAGFDTTRMQTLTLGEVAQIVMLLSDTENRGANRAQIEQILAN